MNQEQQQRTPQEWAFFDGKRITDPVGWKEDDREFEGYNSSLSREEYEWRVAKSVTEPLPDPIGVGGLSDDMKKDAIWRHIREYHSTFGGHFMSKDSKDALLRKHNNLHESATNSLRAYQYKPDQFHTHFKIEENINVTDYPTANTEAVDKAKEIASKGKPLTATQRRALTELIDNDFSVLTGQMRQMANEVTAERLAQVEAEFESKGKKKEEFERKVAALRERQQDAMTALTRQHAQQMDDLREKAKDAGLDFAPNRNGGYSHSVIVAGRDEAIAKAKDEVKAELNRALTEAERQRLSAHRTVLLASVDAKSIELLDTIPDAQTLMLQAQAQTKQIEPVTEGDGTVVL